MIKEEVQLDQVAVHEFDVEHGMLSRISHPNIIQVGPPHNFSPRLVCPTPGLSFSQISLPSPPRHSSRALAACPGASSCSSTWAAAAYRRS